MKNFFQPVYLVAGCFFFSFSTFSQKTVRTEGSAQVRVEANVTKEQTKKQARELAIIKAIDNAFGTYAEQQADITIKERRDYYTIIGTTKVKGDWIETTNEEFIEATDKSEAKKGSEISLWITCKITGKAREASPKAMIEYKALNCPRIECQTTEFISGGSLYLYFVSPVDGYLSVFLEDEEKVYRLFPYTKMTGENYSAVNVKADKGYYLFSKEHRYNAFSVVPDETELHTTKAFEFNNLYVIFSEKPYIKPILAKEKQSSDYKEGYILPKSLSKKDFQDWLSENRAKNTSFLDTRTSIKIIGR